MRYGEITVNVSGRQILSNFLEGGIVRYQDNKMSFHGRPLNNPISDTTVPYQSDNFYIHHN